MLSVSVILGMLASLWGSGALLGWLVRIGLVPFLPVVSKLADLALEAFAFVFRGLLGQLAKQFESVWGVLILAVVWYSSAWHWAEWRPWYGFTKEKAAVHRVVKPAAKAPKVARPATKAQKDPWSIFDDRFNPFR
jgi:hypothetical protein